MTPVPLAIVGIGCRFPGGADRPETFWHLLSEGVDAVTELPPDRYDLAEVFDADPVRRGKLYTRWGGFVERVDEFDAAFFGLSPREATRIDPQHRLLLEVTHEAFEDAGLSTDVVAGSRTGVFVGLSTHDYGDIQMRPANREEIDAHSNTGTAGAIGANRISYAFDLRGPSMVVDTACSSALTALHLAARALEGGECDVAVVGAAQLLLTAEPTIGFCKASMISPDGRCRAFAAAANGYVRSEGAGAVLLKPVDAALAAGDRIYAVVAGTAVNQDGRTNGMTVPSATAQEAMMRAAVARAGLEPHDVQYVEAHGTGTPVGDPIEAAAIGAALGAGRAEPLAIGSVKTNLGHLEAAAGIAGLVKTALAIHRGKIPASLHFEEPNPAIGFGSLGLRVVTETESWPEQPVRTAVVNSFGFGGANAAAVLHAPPPVVAPAAEAARRVHVLPLSARSEGALAEAARSYADLLGQDSVSVDRICAAAALRRGHHDQRLAAVGDSADGIVDGLQAFLIGERRAGLATGRKTTGMGKLGFVFSGMGAQWAGMGRRLLEEEPVFAASLRRCDAALRELAGWTLIDDLLADDERSRVRDGDFAQVSNFAIQAALFELWAHWGIHPDAVVGHSAGEIAGAYACGALDFEQAALLAYHRGRLQMLATGHGKMLALAVSQAEAEALVAELDGVELAAVNAPSSVTLSGDAGVLEELQRTFEERQVFARIVPVAIPYHSAKMDPIREALLDALSGLRPVDGTVPFASVVTGAWQAGAGLDAEYWWQNVRRPVLFKDAVELLVEEGCTTFLEIAPHPVLATSLAEILAGCGATGTVVPSMRRGEDESLVARRAIASLYAEGRDVDWKAIAGPAAPHVDLPRYAWQRERHWFEPAPPAGGDRQSAGEPGPHPLLARRLSASRPAWETWLGEPGLAFLDDHVVQGAMLFPGAGYAEMAVAAARDLLGTESPAVRDLSFERGLLVDGRRDTAVQFAVDGDGRHFEISSLENGSARSWTVHARGVLGEARAERAGGDDPDTIEARCGEHLDREQLYARLAAQGYAYGPAFQGIERCSRGDGEALGLIRLPEGLVDLDGYELHPALLDAALQLLIVAAGERDGAGFLPVRIDEFALYRRPAGQFWAQEFWAHAQVDASAAVGDVRLLDAAGTIAEVKRLHWKVVEPSGSTRETQSDWLYEARWEAKPLAGTASSLADGALDGVITASLLERHAGETDWSDYYTGVEGLLEEAAAAFALVAIQSLGDDEPVAGGRALHGALRRGLEAYGAERAAAADASRALAEIERLHPGYRLDAELLRRCGSALARVLRGEDDARHVLFSGDGLTLLERFYREAPTARFYNRLLADSVSTIVGRNDDSRPVRVLEIGAGTGGTTGYLLPELPPMRTSYLFSDISPAFLATARERWSDTPFLETAHFDIERDPAEQGLEGGSFDLVVAANVLHATGRLSDTLSRVSELLAPGGVLALLEITRRPFWLDVVFGLTEGWWAFTGDELRPDHALLTGEQWRTALGEIGFGDVATIADAPAAGAPGQTVVLARAAVSPGQATMDENDQRHWLVLGDESGVGDALAERLRAGGGACTIARPGEPLPADIHGIVHLTSLDAAPDPIAAQESACLSVLDLLQSQPAELVLVTSGGQELPGEAPAHPSAGTLWGLGRVLVKERPDLRCRLIELGPEPGEDEVAALAAEILATLSSTTGDGEPEVAFAGGTRLVRRLRRVELTDLLPAARPRAAGSEDGYRAEVVTPGVLDSLVLREVERRPPGAGEVEIRVEVAGLNFRDVMFSLGLLPELALRETKGTDRLGLDCAGIVTAIGPGVEHVSVGDPVFGVVYGCLGSFATADARLLVRRPPGLDVEAAAAAPVAFATAQMALLHLARLVPGERVLVHAASGGVGLAALQVAREAGAIVIATAGSEEKRDYLRSLGVEHVFDSRSLDFADDVLKCTGGEGVDVVLNSLAGEAIAAGLSTLAPYGRFVEIGKRDVYDDSRIGLLAFRRNLAYFALDLDRMAAERPEKLGAALVEIAAKLADGSYTPLPVTSFAIGDLEGALRLMAQARHIGKVIVRVDGEPAEISPTPSVQPPVLPDATYLITGGLGGFGLAAAGWLVDQGARSLVLVGRSEPTVEARASLERLVAKGASVETRQADVSSWVDVDRILAEIQERFAPLRGIFHAAMELDDCAVEDLHPERFLGPLGAKAAGAWHLHNATTAGGTLAAELDFFVLFSSIAGVLGNPFQASYAAASAYLDALAHHRRGLGLPALSVDWGVISSLGYVARHGELGAYLERQGFLSFSPDDAFAVLGKLLRAECAQMVVARVDWSRHSEFAPAWAGAPRVRQLVPAAGSSVAEAGVDRSARADLLAGGPAGLAERSVEYVRARIGRVLGVRPDRVDPGVPLTELGLDSLLAVELMTALKTEVGVELPVVRLLQGISVAELAALVAADLPGEAGQGPATLPVEAQAADAELPSALVPVPVRAAPPAVELNGAGDVYRALDYTRWKRSQRAMKALIRGGFAAGARVRVEGLEHLPAEGGFLLAANHLSMADVPLLLTVMPRPAIVYATEELRAWPWLHWFLSDLGNAIYVRKGTGDERSLELGLTVLGAGGILALGPEGRRSATGALERGETGVAFLASHGDVPVVPVAAWGQEGLGANWRRLRRAPVEIRFGPPVPPPPSSAGPAELRGFTDRVMEEIARLLPPEYRGVYAEALT